MPIPFQATRPLRGATLILTERVKRWLFQSTRPLRGATTYHDTPATMPIPFQSTRPLRGATLILTERVKRWLFQSTRPLRGATAKRHFNNFTEAVSIHAPLARRDLGGVEIVGHSFLFQSTRPLRGATFQNHTNIHHGPGFNPRAPCEARLAVGGNDADLFAVSIHAPLARRD